MFAGRASGSARDGAPAEAVAGGSAVSATPPAEVFVAACGSSIRLIARGPLGRAEARIIDTALARLHATGPSITLDLGAASFIDTSVLEVLRRHRTRGLRTGRALHTIPPPSLPTKRR